MKVAIIGAGGFIGRHLCEALSKASVEVVPFSSKPGGCFDPVTGALREPTVDRTIDAVVYLSQSPFYRELPARAAHVWGVNVFSAVTAAAWARQCGATRFVYASSGSVYRNAFDAHREIEPLRRDDWYALSKVQGEEAVSLFEKDLRVIRARLFGVYGPWQRSMLVPRLIDSVRNHQPVRLRPHPANPDDAGGLKLSLCYVDDCVAALARLATADAPAVINIAGSQVCSIREIANTIGQHLGVEPSYQVEPTPRECDLIADNSLLRQLSGGQLSTLEAGIGPTIHEFLSAT